jgi:integrase
VKGSLRERAPEVWELRVRAGRDPLTGRYVQVSRTVHGGKRAAEAALARLITEVDTGAHRGTGESVGYLLDRWIEHLEALGRSPKTIDGYRSIIRARLRPALGSIALRRLQPADLDRFYRALVADGLSALSVRHCHAALSTALRQAVKWGWIDRSPAERATPPPVPRSEVDPPSVEEISQLLRELEHTGHELASMVFVAATTGCRRGELCALRWSDIDLDHAVLVVSRSIAEIGGTLYEKDPKTHRARRLSLDPSTVSILEKHALQMQDRADLFGVQFADDAFVWSELPSCSEPWHPNRVTEVFRSTRRRLGLDRVDFHHLRHFAATTLAGAGVDVRTIAGRLGHADPAVTLRTYAHFLEAADRKAAEVMGRLELGAPPSS